MRQSDKKFLSLQDFLASKHFGASQDHDPHTKKVDDERQQAEDKAKEVMETTVSANAKAIADLKAEDEDAIIKIGITLKLSPF